MPVDWVISHTFTVGDTVQDDVGSQWVVTNVKVFANLPAIVSLKNGSWSMARIADHLTLVKPALVFGETGLF